MIIYMLIIDRFEGKYAVVEHELGEHYNILKTNLPKNAKEGDCIVLVNGIYKIDAEVTKKLRGKAIKLQDSLWE